MSSHQHQQHQHHQQHQQIRASQDFGQHAPKSDVPKSIRYGTKSQPRTNPLWEGAAINENGAPASNAASASSGATWERARPADGSPQAVGESAAPVPQTNQLQSIWLRGKSPLEWGVQKKHKLKYVFWLNAFLFFPAIVLLGYGFYRGTAKGWNRVLRPGMRNRTSQSPKASRPPDARLERQRP